MVKNHGTGHKTPIKGKIHKPLSQNNKIVNPNRTVDKPNMRSRATINRLAMYKQRAVHDKYGNFVSGAYMSQTADTPVNRIAPNRKWFGNTRVIGQKQLETFREEMNIVNNDRYQVVMKPSTLPMSLLNNPFNNTKVNILQNQHYSNIMKSGRIKRKRPTMQHNDISTLAQINAEMGDKYDADADAQIRDKEVDKYTAANAKNDEKKLFEKGQSKRIWSELYKVIDSSDVVIQVLDARDPEGTRSLRIEDELKKPDRRHKQMIFVLNKCDLIPTYVTRKWVKYLSQTAPTLAFHASITNSFGKGSLINLLRQFATLHSDKKQISVGFVGAPNVGKSSIINTLRGKQVCKAAPVPGQTKVWQYITLFKRIFLIDSPGVVHVTEKNANSESNTVLRGVVRIENLHNPTEYIGAVLRLIKPQYIATAYSITQYTSVDNFLDQYARLTGKLLKGGEPDKDKVARMILNDFQRGKLPYYNAAPNMVDKVDKEENKSGLMVEQLYNKINVKHNFDKHAEFRDVETEMAGTDDAVKDWDAEYDGVEGDEVDAEAAEDALGIQHNSGADVSDSDEQEESSNDDDDAHDSDSNDGESSDVVDGGNHAASSTDSAAESGDDAATAPATTASKPSANKTAKRRRHRRRQQDDTVDANGDDAATTFLKEPVKPTERAGNEKPSSKSLNKAKKKRQLAKRKRLRVCK